ncbi:MAG: response regulator transcription factor [Clostridia bacterium]|jgi:two-component system OmpR family response regulator|nr:response regulator transcription factor [Clostridia bacterium]
MFHILLAEDEFPLRKLIKFNLEKRGFSVYESGNGQEALSFLESADVDLMIADIMMPVLDGNRLTQMVKSKNADLPVIMLTALSTIGDKKKSFEGGADDYMTKPVDFDELELRIRALLRRYGRVSKQKIQIGNTELDFLTKTLKVNSSVIETPKKEFLLLFTLLSSLGRIFSRTQLLDEIWGMDSESLERTVDVHINKLREKLVNSDVAIVSVRGLGYKAEQK